VCEGDTEIGPNGLWRFVAESFGGGEHGCQPVDVNGIGGGAA